MISDFTTNKIYVNAFYSLEKFWASIIKTKSNNQYDFYTLEPNLKKSKD